MKTPFDITEGSGVKGVVKNSIILFNQMPRLCALKIMQNHERVKMVEKLARIPVFQCAESVNNLTNDVISFDNVLLSTAKSTKCRRNQNQRAWFQEKPCNRALLYRHITGKKTKHRQKVKFTKCLTLTNLH